MEKKGEKMCATKKKKVYHKERPASFSLHRWGKGRLGARKTSCSTPQLLFCSDSFSSFLPDYNASTNVCVYVCGSTLRSAVKSKRKQAEKRREGKGRGAHLEEDYRVAHALPKLGT